MLDMGQRIIDLYPHITCTERAALLLAMTAAVRQVAANMKNVAALLRKHLLDPFRIDYKDYARKVENLLKSWDEELKGAPIIHNLDNQNQPITNPNDIALREDSHYGLTLQTDNEFDFFDLRVGLMDNASLMCQAVDKGLAEISKTLREIIDDYLRLKANINSQDERMRELEEMYADAMWEKDKMRLKGKVAEYVVLCNGSKDKNTFELFRERQEREATDPHDFKYTAELNEWFLSGERPAGYVVENRDKLTIEDLARHFCFVRSRRMVNQQLEFFDLTQPASADYKDLFVNRAAEELAFLLAPTISSAVDFRHNYQYAALQMAMQDLGLVFKDRGNGIQMMKFVNRAYLNDEEGIKDQTTLTQWTGKLLGTMFGIMDENNLAGNYTRKDFGKMKDCYWLCLSIINKVVQLNLEELQFARYLLKDHELTPNITDYRNRDGQSIMERLSVLKSAIEGEPIFT